MFKKMYLLLVLCLMFNVAHSQHMVFKPVYQSDATYQSTSINTSTSNIDFEASIEKINEMKAQGVKMPMQATNTSTIKSRIITGPKQQNGNIGARMHFDTFDLETQIGGQTQNDRNPLVGMTVIGHYDADGVFNVEDIEGTDYAKELIPVMSTVLRQVQQGFTFPEHAIKIGDTFQNVIPLSIPVSGGSSIDLKLITDLTLIKISNGKAIFATVQTAEMDISEPRFSMTAKGSGTGTCEYDLKNNYLSKVNSDLDMDMSMQMDSTTAVIIKTQIKSLTNVSMQP